MSEYWVSHKKYFCKYCNIYIADDAPSRNHHENGLRHKGNVERFVRGLYKTGEKRKQDLEEEKREMARVEQAAQAAFARDVGSGLVKPGSSSSAPPKAVAPSKPTKKSDNPYENYSTAASLGYTDPDAARREAEAERRRMEGVAGEWEVVATEDSSIATTVDGPSSSAGPSVQTDGIRSGQKRPLELATDEEDSRTFKLRRRTFGGLGDVYDPGLIPIRVRTKTEEPLSTNTTTEPASTTISGSTPSVAPKWTARGWNKPGVEPDRNSGSSSEDAQPDNELQQLPAKAEPVEDTPEKSILSDIAKTLDVKVEEGAVKAEALESPAPTTSSGMFRKRKIRVNGAGVRERTD
ncbi:hypothetical protein BXZ70DRAFT_913590 [Cristinia sonorae]|uniref:Matrin-type domain-containing protein n=1 Tax=Cristinia sonorae TaxID=1940300 RepID=A0A8K0UY54_9AGAR|nr:hypothetical protein BXZ70DRAFT_913590 [Cristinia sonorae]